MPWKQRGDRRYFYDSHREGGKVRSFYYGTGLVAELASERIADGRAMRAEARRESRARREAEHELSRRIDLAERLAASALHAAGFHRPNRGPWRRRRMNETTDPAPLMAPPEVPKEMLRIPRLAERALIMNYLGESKGHDSADKVTGRAFLQGDLLAFAAEIAGPDPTPLVRALALTAAVAYYDWMLCRMTTGTPDPKESVARSIERAERRFQRAAKTLHTVQRHLPESFMAVQINVDARQESAGTNAGIGTPDSGSSERG